MVYIKPSLSFILTSQPIDLILERSKFFRKVPTCLSVSHRIFPLYLVNDAIFSARSFKEISSPNPTLRYKRFSP